MPKENKKSILIVSYYFNEKDTYRSNRVYKALSNNYNVTLLIADYDHYEKCYKKYDMNNCVHLHVSSYNKNMSFSRIKSDIQFALQCKSFLLNNKFDLAYIIIPPNVTSYLLLKTARKMDVKVVVDTLDLHPESLPISNMLKVVLKPFGLWFWSRMRSISLEKSDMNLFSCRYYMERLNIQENDKNRILYLTKGDINDEINNESTIIDTGILRIAYLGSIANIYDFESLIQIINRVSIKRKIELVVIGGGVREEWFLAELNKYEIPHVFYGRIHDEAKKKEILEQCHIGFNGFKKTVAVALSYKSMDYLSYGLALLNSAKLDTWNLVQNEEIGLNYESSEGGIERISNQIIDLSQDDISKMKIKCKLIYQQYFSRKVFESKLIDAIESTLGAEN